jgi:hypothetical protein
MSLSATSSLEHTLGLLLYCPLSQEPLYEAVALVPCAHKVQQAAAEKTWGKANGGWLIENPITPRQVCPICKVLIMGYMVDNTMRMIVQHIAPENQLKKMLQSACSQLVNKKMIVLQPAKMAYPGKPAKLVLEEENWMLNKRPLYICHLKFKSLSIDSLLQEFSFIKYRDGGFGVFVEFLTLPEEVYQYFKSFNTPTHSGASHYYYMSETRDELRIILNIIIQNNEIPISHRDWLKSMVGQ